jgi:hypothetical protein
MKRQETIFPNQQDSAQSRLYQRFVINRVLYDFPSHSDISSEWRNLREHDHRYSWFTYTLILITPMGEKRGVFELTLGESDSIRPISIFHFATP